GTRYAIILVQPAGATSFDVVLSKLYPDQLVVDPGLFSVRRHAALSVRAAPGVAAERGRYARRHPARQFAQRGFARCSRAQGIRRRATPECDPYSARATRKPHPGIGEAYGAADRRVLRPRRTHAA